MFGQNSFTITGTMKDKNSAEDLIGATIVVKELITGTVTNTYGFYSLTLKKGKYTLVYSYIGYESVTKVINLTSDLTINVDLKEMTQDLEDVTITGERIDANIEKVEMSTMKLEMKTIKKIPALMGEVDIIKSVQLMPGVQASNEGSSGFHVRGGSADQNLILLDGANVYNPSHLGGIFSVFNGDAVRNVKLYKGGIPAQFGGRLSSVLDIKMKEGNMRKFSANGGIGTISSRLTVEGPIVKDKASFIISGRRTYVDVFFPLFNNETLEKSKFYFYDLNGKANWQINEKNRLFVSSYWGQDVFALDTLFTFDYGNKTFTTRWNHMFSKKLFSNSSFIYSNFNYSLGVPSGSFSFKWVSKIIDFSIRNDYSYYPNPSNKIDFGIQSIFHDFKPGELEESKTFKFPPLEDKYTLETSVYIQNEQKFNKWLTVQYGLRYSNFVNLGKQTIYSFDDNYNVTDTTKYGPSEIINTYNGIEPRIGLRGKIDEKSSVKLSYNRMCQYLLLGSNTASVTPVDLWFPANPNIKPQYADQIATGYFRNFKDNTFEVSAEIYYKLMHNSVDFEENANLFFNDLFDGEIRQGKAYSYGLEILAKKQVGAFTGWISYTYSKTRRKIPGVNENKEFAAPYDRTNDVSIVLSYDIIKRINISTNWAYSTAIPITVPKGKYNYNGMSVPIYSEKNSIRVPGTDYHRLDLALTLDNKEFNRKGNPRRFKGSWVFSVYNTYARHNAYSIVFRTSEEDPNKTEAVKLYLFKVIPSVTYNFEF